MNEVRLTNDIVLQQDIEMLAKSDSVDWEKLKDKTILVTGATGVIGRQVIMALACVNMKYNLNISMIALVRNKEKAERLLSSCKNFGLKIFVGDVTEDILIHDSIDYIIHGASITSSKDFVNRPVETILTALKGTENVLQLAKQKNVKSMVYLSSMEAYGVVDKEHYIVREKDYGYIDPLEVRSSYSESKRMSECLCASYFHEYNVSVKIARLAQTFGAGIDKEENRVYAQFARSIINDEDIVLHTDGSKAHCYCYTTDAVRGILTILLEGESGEAYNVSNESTFSTIREMAELLIENFGKGNSKLIFDIPEDMNLYGYAPSSKMLVNAEKLMRLGWKPEIEFKEMFRRLIGSIGNEE